MTNIDWAKRSEQIKNKEICEKCYKPFEKTDGYFVDKFNRDGEFFGRVHHDCLGDIICGKCGKHVSDLSSLGELLSPMQDRSCGKGIDDMQRLWICYSCYKLVFHFAISQIGVNACS